MLYMFISRGVRLKKRRKEKCAMIYFFACNSSVTMTTKFSEQCVCLHYTLDDVFITRRNGEFQFSQGTFINNCRMLSDA